jgi:hypothetical protein
LFFRPNKKRKRKTNVIINTFRAFLYFFQLRGPGNQLFAVFIHLMPMKIFLYKNISKETNLSRCNITAEVESQIEKAVKVSWEDTGFGGKRRKSAKILLAAFAYCSTLYLPLKQSYIYVSVIRMSNNARKTFRLLVISRYRG